MSVFIYIHRHPLRTYQETYTKIVYLIVALAMFSALLVTFTLWIGKINNTFDSYFSSRSLQLTEKLAVLLVDCETLERVTVNNRAVDVVVNEDNAGYVFATAVDLQGIAFGTAWPAVVLSVVNKLLYRANIWFIRWKGMLIRTNIILPTVEVFFHVWAIVSIAKTFGPVGLVNDFIEECSSRPSKSTLSDVDHNFSQSLIVLLIVLCVNLAVMALALIRLACDAAEPENAEWAKVRYGDFHRKAKKGIPGIHGNEANDEIVPPKRAILRALEAYPELAREMDQMGNRRVDPSDGQLYTKDEFRNHYGGTQEWDEAMPGPAKAGDLHNFSPAIAGPDQANTDYMIDSYRPGSPAPRSELPSANDV
ncbi:hypothetical protein DIPPA_31656 [Diplonema papillatum]|nr:hypothetical protein DIPPA_31656 [Diplonema papillatum]